MDGSQSDDELLYLMRCGSEVAETVLYDRYYPIVQRWLLSFFGYAQDGYEREDYLQVAMMNFPKILDCYRCDREASLKTFMNHAIRKRMISFFAQIKQKHFKHTRVLISLDASIFQDNDIQYAEVIADPSKSYQPESCLLIKEAKMFYDEHLERCSSAKERAVIKYIQAGYSQKEISQELNISIRSVYNATYRYHKKCKSLTSENKCVKLY